MGGTRTALLGIVLVAFTLRQAVAAVSPILGDIRVDIPISTLDVGLLGTLPPILFAASGFIAPRVARRVGLDGGIVLALVLMTAGHLVRAFAPGFAVLLVGSVVAFAGTGIGNVLLPSVVRRYFPDRVALLTAVYACIVGVSTAVPAALAAPVAERAGWRFSLGIWSVTSVVALVPWLAGPRAGAPPATLGRPPPSSPPPPALVTRLWRSRVALSITVVFSTSTICTYAGFAWLPEILGDVAGSTPTEAGVLLAVTGLVSVPGALVAPLLVARLRNVGWLIAAGSRELRARLPRAAARARRRSPCCGCCSSARGRSCSRSASCSSTRARAPPAAPSRSAASPRAWRTRSARSARCSSGCCTT